MTRIAGTIRDSAGNALSGVLTVTQQATVVSDGSVITVKPKAINITDGVVDIDVPATELNRTVCRFVFTVDGGVWLDWTAVVPFTTSTVSLGSLAQSSLTQDSLDTTVRRLAQLILSDSSLAAQLRPRFIPAGEWVAETRYYANNLVTVNGSSYYLVANSSLGQPPVSNPTVWQLLAQRGEAGTGVTGYSQVYGPAWDGSTAPPTQNDLFDIIETKYDKVSAQELAPKANPTFTGTVTTPAPASNTAYGNNPATTKWLWDIMEGASLLSRAAPTTPGAPTPSTTDSSGKLATTQFVKNYLSTFTPYTNGRAISITESSGKRLLILAGYTSHNQTWASIQNSLTNFYYASIAVPAGNWTVLSAQFSVVVPTDYGRNTEFDATPTPTVSGNTYSFVITRTASGTLTINIQVHHLVVLIEV